MTKKKLPSRPTYPIEAFPFEAFHDDLWYRVKDVRIKNGSLTVQFEHHDSGTWEIVPNEKLRLRSRKATPSDCRCFLRPGMDICVFSAYPNATIAAQENVKPAWHDAKIISIEKRPHDYRCTCDYYVSVYSCQDQVGKRKRTLENSIEKVTIDNIAILQKLIKKPYEDECDHRDSSEDCFSVQNSKLFVGTFLSEVSWLIVLSIFNKADFHIRSNGEEIVYLFLNRDQGAESQDSFSLNSDHVKAISFHRKYENVQLQFETFVPVVRECMFVPPKVEMDDVNLTHDVHELTEIRCSTRQRAPPDRYVGYSFSTGKHRSKKSFKTQPLEIEFLSSSTDEDVSEHTNCLKEKVEGEMTSEDEFDMKLYLIQRKKRLKRNNKSFNFVKQKNSGLASGNTGKPKHVKSYEELKYRHGRKLEEEGSCGEDPNTTELQKLNKKNCWNQDNLTDKEFLTCGTKLHNSLVLRTCTEKRHGSSSKHRSSCTMKTKNDTLLNLQSGRKVSSLDRLNHKGSNRKLQKGNGSSKASKISSSLSLMKFRDDSRRYRYRFYSTSEYKKMVEKCMKNIENEIGKKQPLVVAQWKEKQAVNNDNTVLVFDWPSDFDDHAEVSEHEDLWKEMENALTGQSITAFQNCWKQNCWKISVSPSAISTSLCHLNFMAEQLPDYCIANTLVVLMMFLIVVSLEDFIVLGKLDLLELQEIINCVSIFGYGQLGVLVHSPAKMLGNLVKDIRRSAHLLDFARFSSIPRELNNAAHLLAKLCSRSFDDVIWTESFPRRSQNIEKLTVTSNGINLSRVKTTFCRYATLKDHKEPGMEFSGAFGESSHEGGRQSCQHEYRINEEVGIVCSLCNYVITEMRYVSPRFLHSCCWVRSEGQFSRDKLEATGTYNFGLDPFGSTISSMGLSSFEQLDSVWSLIPKLKWNLHDHQKKGFEFLWRNIAGSLNPGDMELASEKWGGCVVSHPPGAGKTLLVISFLESYLSLFPQRRPLILAPNTTLYAWYREFEKWEVSYPVYQIHALKNFHKLRKSMQQCRRNEPMGDITRDASILHFADCLEKFRKWHEQPSVLLMSYPSFFAMTRRDSRFEHRRYMAEVLRTSPGILILDEGHNPRSTRSKLRKAIMEVKTDLRILLSGTLFQNNFEEYFNTLCLARPKFVDEVAAELKIRNIKQGKRDVSIRREKRARKYFVEKIGRRINSHVDKERNKGLEILKKITNGFVDVYNGITLDRLPGLQCYTLLMKPTDMQQKILSRLQQSIPQKRYPLEIELLITFASIHPWLIKTVSCVSKFFCQEELDNLDAHKFDVAKGTKTKFVIDLVRQCIMKREKVLIFCRNIAPINLFVEILDMVLGWKRNKEVLVLHGEMDLIERARVMDTFKEHGSSQLLLASTAACAEGISLTAASRVVMLDSEWNPSKTKQAIHRAFRPGQEKVVYVYQLLASGTIEEGKYDRNEMKARQSRMIFTGSCIDDSSYKQTGNIDDDVLREIVEDDQTKAFNMIMKHEKLITTSKKVSQVLH